jgi:hypothetical protein
MTEVEHIKQLEERIERLEAELKQVHERLNQIFGSCFDHPDPNWKPDNRNVVGEIQWAPIPRSAVR